MTAPGSFSRSLFLLGLGYFISAFANASGQTTSAYSEMAQQADNQLNRAYQQVMQKLEPKARDQLRNSQRAWLGFVEQNTIALRSACAKLGWTEDQCNEGIVGEVDSRTAWLNGLVERQTLSDLPKSKIEELLPRLDAELNIVYQRCLHAVPEEQATQLRQAQRAWLTCRDSSRALGTKLVYYMLSHRIDQLNNFYSGPTKQAQVNWEEKADSSVPDPFERGGR